MKRRGRGGGRNFSAYAKWKEAIRAEDKEKKMDEETKEKEKQKRLTELKLIVADIVLPPAYTGEGGTSGVVCALCMLPCSLNEIILILFYHLRPHHIRRGGQTNVL